MESDVLFNDSNGRSSVGNKTERVLEPYSHQVGGRSLILNYDRCTLCKPMNPQERQFYEDLPAKLQSFTPKYKGVIQVGYRTSNNGQVNLIAYPANGMTMQDINFNNGYGAASICIADVPESDQDLSTKTRQEAHSDPDHSQTGAMNPWTFHCQYLHLQRLHKAWQGTHNPQDFILMENIASNLVHPCIMDLKMGDKGHSDYSNEEKQERQRAKCNASTSRTLGVRIAGVQVYKSASRQYTYRNKYYGFELNRDGFKEELSQFVHDGHRVRTEMIPAFIEKLKKLHASVNSLDGSRFYSSSLLLIYDGEKQPITTDKALDTSRELMDPVSGSPPLSDGCSADIRMIDFGRSFHASSGNHREALGPDKGYLFGIESLIKVFQEIVLECNQ